MRHDNGRRLEKLEKLLESLDSDRYAPIHSDFLAFDEELTVVAPAPHWVGNTKVEEKDEAYAHFGRSYSQREYFELTMRRALAKRGCYSDEEVAERTAAWMAWFEKGGPMDDVRCLGGGGNT